MGNNNSSNQDDLTKVGYRVLGVQAKSPAAKVGLVSFFDFIVEANGIPLRSLDSTFIDLIKVYILRLLGVFESCLWVMVDSQHRHQKTNPCHYKFTTGRTSQLEKSFWYAIVVVH